MTIETPKNVGDGNRRKRRGKRGSLENVIDSDQYEVVAFIGRGTNGKVFRVWDRLSKHYKAIKVLDPLERAAKRMTEERKLTPETALAHEEMPVAASRVVNSMLQVDKKGRQFLVMPALRQSLADRLYENKEIRGRYRDCVDNEHLTEEEPIKYLASIAEGLDSIHSVMSRPYLDLKLDNIMIGDDENANLVDFGTATNVSIDVRDSMKCNRGYRFTRAPEGFGDDDEQIYYHSDSYSFASLAARLFTGKYLFEDELKKSDPKEFFKGMDANKMKKLVKKQLDETFIPLTLRKLIIRCASLDPADRPRNGQELRAELKEAIENLDTQKLFTKKFIGGLKAAAIAAAITIPLAIMGYRGITHEPLELSRPDKELIVKFPKEIGEKDIMEFEFEELQLPRVKATDSGEYDRQSKRNTKNRFVAYLTKTHAQAVNSSGEKFEAFGRFMDGTSEYQRSLYVADSTRNRSDINYVGSNWQAVKRAIEAGIQHSRTRGGKVDLEDVCAIARLGPEKVMEAKRVSASEDYGKYKNAKNEDGSYVLDRKEIYIVDRWISHYHAGEKTEETK